MAWSREEWHKWLDEQLDAAGREGKLFNAFSPDEFKTALKTIGRGRTKRKAHVLSLSVNLDSSEFLPQHRGSTSVLLRSSSVVILAVPKDTLVDPDPQ